MSNKQIIATLQDLQPLHDLLDADYPLRLREITEFLFLELLQNHSLKSFDPRELAQLSINQAARLCEEMGGMTFYLMKGTSYIASKRDESLWDSFNGQNYIELARAFNLTEARVRQIIDSMRKKFTERNQQKLNLE